MFPPTKRNELSFFFACKYAYAQTQSMHLWKAAIFLQAIPNCIMQTVQYK